MPQQRRHAERLHRRKHRIEVARRERGDFIERAFIQHLGEAPIDPRMELGTIEGRNELDQVAAALVDLDRQIPTDIPWVLRVDGHTDSRPITSPQFPSNWELSSARAIAVVQYLISKGVSPQRLVAAGFGEFQPIDPARTDDAYQRNRRIELKLTER
jgi:outer membrane protein OmpA-like peptidoglycan-associated protein